MTQKASEVLMSALALTPQEREELADSLWASLDPQDPLSGMSETEWIAELNRRAAELKGDPKSGVRWDDVKNMT